MDGSFKSVLICLLVSAAAFGAEGEKKAVPPDSSGTKLLTAALGIKWLENDEEASVPKLAKLVQKQWPGVPMTGHVKLLGVKFRGGPLDGARADIKIWVHTGKVLSVEIKGTDLAKGGLGADQRPPAQAKQYTLEQAAKVLRLVSDVMPGKPEAATSRGHEGWYRIRGKGELLGLEAVVSPGGIGDFAMKLIWTRSTWGTNHLPYGFTKFEASRLLSKLGGPDIRIGSTIESVLEYAEAQPDGKLDVTFHGLHRR